MFIYVSQFLIYFFNHFIYTTLCVPSVQPTLRELADCSPDHDDINKRDFVPRGIFFHINKCMKKTLNVNMCILLLKLHLPTFPPRVDLIIYTRTTRDVYSSIVIEYPLVNLLFLVLEIYHRSIPLVKNPWTTPPTRLC